MSLIDAVEASGLFTALSQRMRPVVDKLVGAPGVRHVLSGSWLGHPAHPMTVIAPMSAWFSSAFLDVTGGPAARPAAQTLRVAGVVAAVPSLASGASDWLDTTGAEQRVGAAHSVANNAALALFGLSWWRHRAGAHRAGTALALAGSATLGVGGYLGGHLAYRRGVGVDTTAFAAGPAEWTALDGSVADRRLSAHVAGDVALVATRLEGRVRVLEDRCTHRGGPLHEGDLADGCVTCPWHSSVFDIATGAVRRGPAVAPQPAYEVREVRDRVEVRRQEAGSLRANAVGPSAVARQHRDEAAN